jgi:hypothetical protein
MECLNISEADLVRALMKWGKFQLQKPNSKKLGESLRSKILPGLQQIRFNKLTQKEVAYLFLEELGGVLTGDEKCAIFMSINTGDWDMMPPGVFSSSKLLPRFEPYTFCPLQFEERQCPNKIIQQRLSFNFEIDREAAIIGVKLDLPAFFRDSLTSIELYDERYETIGTGDPKLTFLHRGETCYKIIANRRLHSDMEYIVEFYFDGSASDKVNKAYALPQYKHLSISEGLALTITTAADSLFFFNIKGILFEKDFTSFQSQPCI